jgi:ABC-2 type transport system permease protein
MKSNNVDIAILDKSKDSETQKKLLKLASNYFNIEKQISNEKKQIYFYKGKLKPF